MTKKLSIVCLVFACLAIILVATRIVHREQPARSPANSSATSTNISTVSQPSTNPVVASSTTDVTLSMLQQVCAALRAAKDGDSARQELEKLRALLAAMPPAEAAALIRQFLDSKEDAATHLGFTVGQGGLLADAPTFRTFLLDELARIDRAAAADYSKTILQSKDSPDEWAVALRNLAWGDANADGHQLLEQKTEEMLADTSWQESPSTGFLEAFDTAVYVGGTNLLPTLTGLLQKSNNPALTHASFLALDRLTINDPQTTLSALLADPSMLNGHEATRADYFARANVSDPAQRQLVENYLLNPQISAAELNAFAGIFPNANYMISPNLLTSSQPPDRASLVSRDAAALKAVQGWLADPRFAQLQPQLSQMETRIAGYVQQESQGH